MIQRVYASMRFMRYRDAELLPFGSNVAANLTANSALFDDPPVTPAEITTLVNAFETALANTVDRGLQDTATKKIARTALVDALRQDAVYVGLIANGQEAIILKAGYLPTSANRAPQPLEVPQVLKVETPGTGQIKVRIRANRNARSFQGRIREVSGGAFGPVLSFASSRRILFEGLQAGVAYVFELCAIGGSNGKSDWTEPVTKRAM